MRRDTLAGRVLSRLELFGTRLGLETTRRLLTSMGDPHLEPATVLVAGTNGKGSVAALVAAIGSAAGYKTGLFTSPHLETVTERLRLDGRAIGGERLGELLQEIDGRSRAVAESSATYFEALFVAACRWFAEEGAELVILEVGLGGRLDATNVSEPVISVITEIDLEHRAQLGDSVEEIAFEKAGILRRDRPAIVGARSEAAVKALRREAMRVGAEWWSADERLHVITKLESEDWSQEFRLRSPADEYNLRLHMAGAHQEQNLLTAMAAAEALAENGFRQIDRRAIEEGVQACSWPGRLERVEIEGRREIVLDCAHNPHAIRALAGFLRQRLPEHVLVFGILEDKDAGAMLPDLATIAEAVFLTRPDSSRSRNPHELVQWSDCAETEVLENPEAALDRALATGKPVVICGSIYLVGTVRQLLRRRFGVPAPV